MECKSNYLEEVRSTYVELSAQQLEEREKLWFELFNNYVSTLRIKYEKGSIDAKKEILSGLELIAESGSCSDTKRKLLYDPGAALDIVKNSGTTQEDLAKELGMSPSYLSKILKTGIPKDKGNISMAKKNLLDWLTKNGLTINA